MSTSDTDSRANSPSRNPTTTTTTTTTTTKPSPSPVFSDILASFAPTFLSSNQDPVISTKVEPAPTSSLPLITDSNNNNNNKTTTPTSTLLSSSPHSINITLPRSSTDPDLKGLGLGLAGLRNIPIRNFTTGGGGGGKDDRSTIGSGSVNDSARKTRRRPTGVIMPEFIKDIAAEEEEVVEDGVGKGLLVLEKYVLYETKLKYYVIASNQADSRYRVLKIDRSLPPPRVPRKELDPEEEDEESGTYGLDITEDATIYSKDEIRELLETLSAGNVGGATRVEALFYGIAGFVRFTGTYYMILIKARAPVALVGGHYIYHCEETVLRAVSPVTGNKSSEEARLLASFQGVDMTKNFYFSYTYDLTHTLQHNLTLPIPDPTAPPPPPVDVFSTFNDKWVWNRHILRPAFRDKIGKSPWLLPLIHGFVDQAKLSVFGRTIYITLIARRSRHFAGARFLKRGVNDRGYVANDVETEQIVSEALITPFYSPALFTATGGKSRKPNPRYTSFVQVRGSIPLYWSQESVNMSPKPPIELTIVDPYFSAAALHFDDLLGRYGGPITILNLIKQKERAPRESKLLPEFQECITYLNQFLPPPQRLKYIAWDIAAANKQRNKDVIGFLEDIAEEGLAGTDFFHTGPEPAWYALNTEPGAPPYRATPLLQSGVIRTNCIDCLDRTNAAQFVIAKAALGHQLLALGIIHNPVLPFDSDAVNLITEMYHDHGDTIALQYGGSHLVNTMETYRSAGLWSSNNRIWSSHSRDMIENLRRYYANSFVDADKQTAIDLFLGIDANKDTTPHPLTQQQIIPRRSYRDWFTPANLLPLIEPEEAQRRLGQPVEEDENYWQYYYRPKLFTEIARHFAFKVNSTDKYTSTGAGSDNIEQQSPFVPRLAPAPAPRLAGPVRRWINHRGNQQALLRAQIQSQRIDEIILSSPTPPVSNSTESLSIRLLNPTVEIEEAKEYESYVSQFKQLSLAQELSERDRLIYKFNAALARGEGLGEKGDFGMGGGGKLSVDRSSLAIYTEAVKVSRTID